MLFIRPVTILGGGKLDIEVASMATVPRTASPVFGRILKQIRRAWGGMTMWREGVLKELHLHSENPFGNKIWIPSLIFRLCHTQPLLRRVSGITSNTRCVFYIVKMHNADTARLPTVARVWDLKKITSCFSGSEQLQVQMSKQGGYVAMSVHVARPHALSLLATLRNWMFVPVWKV